jgi:hypothetical protein
MNQFLTTFDHISRRDNLIRFKPSFAFVLLLYCEPCEYRNVYVGCVPLRASGVPACRRHGHHRYHYHNAYNVLSTFYCLQSTVHCLLYIVYCRLLLSILYCLLLSALISSVVPLRASGVPACRRHGHHRYYLLSTIYYLLSTIYYLLSTIYYLLSTIYYLLSTIYCQLSTIYYLLSTIYYLLSTVNCLLPTV